MDIYIPSGMTEKEMFEKTTHLAIAAHQDDLEIMAYEAIEECYNSDELYFLGVIVTNGAKSPRTGKYKDFTDEMMIKERMNEQKKAADTGKYIGVIQLGFGSNEVTGRANEGIEILLKDIIKKSGPKNIYTHNLFDKHKTHIGVSKLVIKAINGLKGSYKPKKFYGCEVWGSLDWVPEKMKIIMASHNVSLAKSLVDVFESQIEGGKDYTNAVLGRRSANATFLDSHNVDKSRYVSYAIDMISMVKGKEIQDYINEYLDEFKKTKTENINEQ